MGRGADTKGYFAKLCYFSQHLAKYRLGNHFAAPQKVFIWAANQLVAFQPWGLDGKPNMPNMSLKEWAEIVPKKGTDPESFGVN